MKNISCLFILALCACACSEGKKKLVRLVPQDSIEIISNLWKKDSLGCARQRDPEKIKQLIAQLELVGKDSSLVFKYLGVPEGIKYTGGDTTVFYYYMACGIKRGSGYNFYCGFKGKKMFSTYTAILE
jgi:hypothetical protein